MPKSSKMFSDALVKYCKNRLCGDCCVKYECHKHDFVPALIDDPDHAGVFLSDSDRFAIAYTQVAFDEFQRNN